MKPIDTHTRVEPGIYFNPRRLRFRSMERAGVLPGGGDDVFFAVPWPVMLVAGPLIGLAYVIFLPFVGLVMLAGIGLRTLARWVRQAGGFFARLFRRPRPRPSGGSTKGQTPGEVDNRLADDERSAA